MRERFNPAPGWPAPPPGWQPPTGWRPDPSWPPAPPGWNFWITDEIGNEGSESSAPLKPERLQPERLAAPTPAQGPSAQVAPLPIPPTPTRTIEVATPESVVRPRRIRWRDRRRYHKQLAEWQMASEALAALQRYLHALQEPGMAGQTLAGLALKRGERVACLAQDGQLIEPRRQPGQYVGGSSGFSVPLGAGLRYHVGATKGTYVQGNEVQTRIDRGVVVISDQRVLFLGSTANREWAYPKLVRYDPSEKGHAVGLAVSNRQKVSGVASASELLFLAVTVGFNVWQQGLDAVAQSIQQEAEEHERERPQLGEEPTPAGG